MLGHYLWCPPGVGIETKTVYPLQKLYMQGFKSVKKFVLLADNTNKCCTVESLQQLLHEIIPEMNKLQKWFHKRKLFLNLEKIKLM